MTLVNDKKDKACVDKEPERTASSDSVKMEIVDSAPKILKRKVAAVGGKAQSGFDR